MNSVRSETSVSVTAHGVGGLLGSSNLSIFALKFNFSKGIIHSGSYTVKSVVSICASLSYTGTFLTTRILMVLIERVK